MSSASRPESFAVADRLRLDPQAHSFVQAMRLLERLVVLGKPGSGTAYPLQGRMPLAGFSPPAREVVRLKGDHSLSFPESEIAALEKSTSEWSLRVSHIGLTGSMGVLPFHYTELILQRIKQKDLSLRDFLDLFNHRIASLYYQASLKYRLPLEYERRRLFRHAQREQDTATHALLSLVGMGTGKLAGRSAFSDESLVYFGGLLSSQVRTASGLKQILEHYFGIPVSIQEFVGQWQELIPDIRTRLGSRQMPKGQNASLGKTVVLGAKGWFSQGKIRIKLGPLNYNQFVRFAPGTRSLKALNDLVRFYVGVENDYSFAIQVQRKNFPRKVSLSKKTPALMGWNTWLSADHEAGSHDDKHLTIQVSANRLNNN